MTKATVTKLRTKSARLTGKIAMLYKEGKCRDCYVSVTQMDFAKILGNFSKVKVVFENGEGTPERKAKEDNKEEATRLNTRLSSNENGMVLIPRSTYKSHPVKEPKSTNKTKQNILKESNLSSQKKDKNSNYNLKKHSDKKYRLKFIKATMRKENLSPVEIKFNDLIVKLNKSVLPSEEWIIDYLPKDSELKKVYDRVEAELADLMNNDSSEQKDEPSSVADIKEDAKDEVKSESAMETESQSLPILETEENKPEIDSSETKMEVTCPQQSELPDVSDIKADDNVEPSEMLADQSLESQETSLCENKLENATESPAKVQEEDSEEKMETDEVTKEPIPEINEIKEDQIESENAETRDTIKMAVEDSEHMKQTSELEESQEAENKGKTITENKEDTISENKEDTISENKEDTISENKEDTISENKEVNKEAIENKEIKEDESNELLISLLRLDNVDVSSLTEITFKYLKDNNTKTVRYFRNLNYDVEIDGTKVTLVGAPKHITSCDDLKVLLEIVNECNGKSFFLSS